jgi:hypothetical protein
MVLVLGVNSKSFYHFKLEDLNYTLCLTNLHHLLMALKKFKRQRIDYFSGKGIIHHIDNCFVQCMNSRPKIQMKTGGFFLCIFLVVFFETTISHFAVHDCSLWVWHWLPRENELLSESENS